MGSKRAPPVKVNIRGYQHFQGVLRSLVCVYEVKAESIRIVLGKTVVGSLPIRGTPNGISTINHIANRGKVGGDSIDRFVNVYTNSGGVG